MVISGKDVILEVGEVFWVKRTILEDFLYFFWVSKLYERFEEDNSVVSSLGYDIKSCAALC